MPVQLWYVLTNLHFFFNWQKLINYVHSRFNYMAPNSQSPPPVHRKLKMWKNIMFQLCPATIIAIWQRSTLTYTLTWLTSHNVNVRFIVKATLDIVINYLQTLARIDLNPLIDPVLEQVRAPTSSVPWNIVGRSLCSSNRCGLTVARLSHNWELRHRLLYCWHFRSCKLS